MTHTTHDRLREILKDYRYKPVMEDLNPTAWENVFVDVAIKHITSLLCEKIEGMKKSDCEYKNNCYSDECNGCVVIDTWNDCLTDIKRLLTEVNK